MLRPRTRRGTANLLATASAAVPCWRQRRLAPTLERPVDCCCLAFLVVRRPAARGYTSNHSARLRLPCSADGKRGSHGHDLCHKKMGRWCGPEQVVYCNPSLLNANEVMNHDLVMSLATHPRNPDSWADCALPTTFAGRELIPIEAAQVSLRRRHAFFMCRTKPQIGAALWAHLPGRAACRRPRRRPPGELLRYYTRQPADHAHRA